jgi:hypothetical protein
MFGDLRPNGGTSHESNEDVLTNISKGMKVIDKLRLDNFNLKKQIAYDKKKYIDLKNAFLELR